MTSNIKIPSSALSLYVKIYCKKRNENGSKTHDVSLEATKSWLTLSEYEKHQFISKYQQLKRDIRKQLADQLKNAIPYLKKKAAASRSEVVTTSQTQEIESENLADIQEHSVFDAVNQSTADVTDVANIEENIQFATNNEFNNSNEREVQNPNSKETNETYITPLSEPIPPKLLTGQQLFELVNERSEGQSWTSLTRTEKRRYQNAVLSIKRNYLRDYKKYLEFLPSEKLYEHYKNIVL